MKNCIEYSQQLFSVSDFPYIMQKLDEGLQHKREDRRLIDENKHHETVFTYCKLSDDILLLHQQTECYTKHRIHFTPKQNKQYYQLKFLLKSNKMINIIKSGNRYDVHQGFMTLYNNTAGYTIELPDDFSKESLQLIISHNFLDQYVSHPAINNKVLFDTLTQEFDQLFVLPNPPNSIKKNLKQLAKRVVDNPNQPPQNLELLNKVSTLLNQLFQMDLPEVELSSGVQNLSKNLAYRVAEYLDNHRTHSFPGMDFLAAQFGISVSGLKRHFKQSFETTPFQYYRNQQMELASKKLQDSSQNVSDVAQYLGFDTSSNFIRTFKLVFDMTPGEYQEKHAK